MDGELSLSTLTLMTKWGMRPFETLGELEGGRDRLRAGLADAADGGNRGIFTRILSVEPVRRGTQSARLAGVPPWFFDMIEAQDRRSNGGPPLDA